MKKIKLLVFIVAIIICLFSLDSKAFDKVTVSWQIGDCKTGGALDSAFVYFWIWDPDVNKGTGGGTLPKNY